LLHAWSGNPLDRLGILREALETSFQRAAQKRPSPVARRGPLGTQASENALYLERERQSGDVTFAVHARVADDPDARGRGGIPTR
jgi:hypothetical protein